MGEKIEKKLISSSFLKLSILLFFIRNVQLTIYKITQLLNKTLKYGKELATVWRETKTVRRVNLQSMKVSYKDFA